MRRETYHDISNPSLLIREGGMGGKKEDTQPPVAVCKGWTTIHVGDFPPLPIEEAQSSSSSSYLLTTALSSRSRKDDVDFIDFVEADTADFDDTCLRPGDNTESQLLHHHSGPPARIRPDDTRGEVVPNRGQRRTGWLKTTLSTGIWSGRLWRRKQTTPLLPADSRSGPSSEDVTRTPSKGRNFSEPKGGGGFEPNKDEMNLGDIPTTIYVDTARTEGIDPHNHRNDLPIKRNMSLLWTELSPRNAIQFCYQRSSSWGAT